MNMKAEILVMHLQAKQYPKTTSKPPEARREAWNISSLTDLIRNQPCPHVDLGHLASRTKKKINFCCLSHPVCGTLLHKSRNLIQMVGRITRHV